MGVARKFSLCKEGHGVGRQLAFMTVFLGHCMFSGVWSALLAVPHSWGSATY